MRILHVFHHYKPCRGGVEKVIEELNRNLHSEGHECSVLCLNRCPKSMEKMPSTEKFEEALVERIPFVDLHYYKFAPFSLGKLNGFDLIHVHGLGFFADYLAITKFIHKKPLVLSTHGAIFHTKSIPLLKKIYFSLWCRIMFRAFCKVIAVSEHDYMLFKKIVPAEKLAVIENAIDAGKLQQYHGDPTKNDLLFVGRLSKNKGLPELLETLAIVKKEMPDFKLRIIGKEFDLSSEDLKNEIEKLNLNKNVVILGEVDEKELMDTYMISGIFVSASRYEGFGISALEAMGAGLVPVLNKIPSFSGFIKNGENGFIVDFSNSNEAAKTLLNVMRMDNSKRKQLGENAKKFASRFDWAGKAKEYEKIYAECAKC